MKNTDMNSASVDGINFRPNIPAGMKSQCSLHTVPSSRASNGTSRLALAMVVLGLTASWCQAAALITFEAPGYTVNPLNGQNGWVTTSSSWYVTNDDPIAGLQSAHVDGASTAQLSPVGQDLQNGTSVGGLMEIDPTGAQPATLGNFFLENTNAQYFVGIWANPNRSLYYLNSNSTAWINTGLTYDVNEVIQFTVTLDFTNQNYDLTLLNLTTSVGNTYQDVAFSDPTTTAEALGFVTVYGQGAKYDNITVVPEPGVLGFLALAGMLFAGSRTRMASRRRSLPIASN